MMLLKNLQRLWAGRNEVGYLRKNDFRKYNKASTDW